MVWLRPASSHIRSSWRSQGAPVRGRATSRKVVFTMAELSTLVGMSSYRTENLLRSNQVPIHRMGSRKVVLISSIESAFPDLTDAVRFRHEED